jgi:hypothetical protein
MNPNLQAVLLVSVPTFAVLVGILINNARLTDLNRRIDVMENNLNRRMDALKDLWRAGLRRIEEVLDARLKHLEEKS